MINAIESILLLSKYTDQEQRRAAYRVTRLDGVSAHEVSRNTDNGGYAAKERVMSVRIPDVSKYVPESLYESGSDKWTVKNQDLMILLVNEPENVSETLYESDVNDLAKSCGYHAKAYRITEYADNSRRGSGKVRHIRIVGE